MLELDELKQEAANAEDVDRHVAKSKAFLEFLLECHFNDPSFTEEHVREEVDTFMFAGHDTTGMGLSYVLYCIGLHPEVQKKIVEELDEIFQNDNDREVTCEDLTKLKYLECTIKETFRLYPPVPFFLRECNETFEVLGHKVHRGSLCFIFPYALHRDRESFPNPEKFIPERFFPENSRERHPYAYIPFSAGPRNCIVKKSEYTFRKYPLPIGEFGYRFDTDTQDWLEKPHKKA
ncbi:Cytochrome P450 4V2 [Araneus ventricosus]|uniref:Cytochrome P450 4V2 n=1 Tax=Araneus ventricosus TaxID=182803 RepID=A0A4Y2LHF8_ARAVE|nr:Cytochrome P450 4V2 [Araneus ventricosus]